MITSSHAVQFYDNEADLIRSIRDYIADGWTRDEIALVIATPEHRSPLPVGSPDAARAIFLDAQATLDSFMVDGAPDPERFDAVIGGLVRDIAERGGRAHAYGEMVALLWDQGNVGGAIELERLWNGLLERVGFTLLCAYPRSIIGTGQDESIAHVCELHSEVMGDPLSASRAKKVSRAFPCDIEASAWARRFVAETLRRWDLDGLIDKASLVVSELAANCVIHAHSEFTLTISLGSDAVRIGVIDGNDHVPAVGDAPAAAIGGRGLQLVQALADAWGVDKVDGGKNVWVELRTAEETAS